LLKLFESYMVDVVLLLSVIQVSGLLFVLFPVYNHRYVYLTAPYVVY
jgi:hypothetical protein